MTELECVFCGHVARASFEPAAYWLLAEHLVQRHRGVEVHGGKSPLQWNSVFPGNYYDDPEQCVRCWCGLSRNHEQTAPLFVEDTRRVWTPHSARKHSGFSMHLAKRGGLAAHVLELALGAERKKRRKR